MSKISKVITSRATNLIYKITVAFTQNAYSKDCYHLDYEDKRYREKELISILYHCLPFFALTPQEFKKFRENDDNVESLRLSWQRISSTDPLKKGDYGELLLFILLEIFYPARKFVTKVRLRTSQGDQIKGFDCAHFTIEKGEPVLWLGEAKFTESISNAINKAFSSLSTHLDHAYIHKEIDILASNIEYNYNEDDTIDESFKILEDFLTAKTSIDKIKFKIPILLTYDSTCVNSNFEISSNFQSEISTELEKISNKIEEKKIDTKLKVDFIFLILPLKSLSWIKQELNKLELISKTYA